MLEEAYCEHANEGNTARRTECGVCFDNVRAESDKMWGTGGEMDMAALRMETVGPQTLRHGHSLVREIVG